MKKSGNIPNETQEARVLDVLKKANGQWVNKQYFIRTLFLTQAGRAIYNLENSARWQSHYLGYKIEHSDFKDEWGFKSYRLVPIEGSVISQQGREEIATVNMNHGNE